MKNKKGKRVLKPVKSTKVKNKLKSKNKIFNKENLMKGVDSALKFLNLSDIEDTVSFTITFTTTKPMATKLLNTLENINFHNNEEGSKKDFKNEEKINKNTQIFEVSEDNYNIIEELDNFDKIKKLKEFYDMGILTEEEFEKKKKELLDL